MLSERESMPTLVIHNVPQSLFEQIERVAQSRQKQPSEMLLEVLEKAFHDSKPAFSLPPVPQKVFLSEEIVAPYSIPRPEGKPTLSVRVAKPLPSSHDVPDRE
jgi:hypothetical protein